MNHKTILAGAVASTALLAAGATAEGSAPPVGPIPKGPVSAVTTQKGQLVAVALPRKTHGLVWRLARRIDPAVLQQVSEADVGRSIVVVFRATGKGTARVVFALTRGETPRALASVTHTVRVTCSAVIKLVAPTRARRFAAEPMIGRRDRLLDMARNGARRTGVGTADRAEVA